MLYLLRHGDAEDGIGKDDADRELTPKGRRQSTAAGEAMKILGFEIEACLASTRVRAADTARLACEPLGLEVELTGELRGGPFDPLALSAGRGDVLLVGHEPDFSDAVARLTGAQIKLKKGGLVGVEGNLLHVFLRPAELRVIAAGGA